jgi:hypothetical protein
MSQAGQFFKISLNNAVEFLTGDTGGEVPADSGNNINILGGDGITTTGDPGTNTITISADGAVALTYDEDVGSAVPAANILNINGAHGINTLGSGSTVTIAINNAITLGDLSTLAANAGAVTAASGDIIITAGDLTLPNTNAAGNQGIIKFGGSSFIHNYGTFNTFVGQTAGNTTLTVADADGNTGIGYDVLTSLTTGTTNVGVGSAALRALTTAAGCTGCGAGALERNTSGNNNSAFGPSLNELTTGSNNTACGSGALFALVTGSNNLALGLDAATNYETSESNNIIIGNIGVTGESNVIRIGTTGSGTGQQDLCYIAGINGVNVGSVASVVSISGDNLGLTTITAGTGVTVTPGANTITIAATGTPTGFTYKNVATSPYVVLTTDQYLSVNASGGPITIELPNAATTGQSFIIKDRTGSAATNNITITTVGGAVNIDGATTFVMDTSYQSVEVIGNSSSYEIF